MRTKYYDCFMCNLIIMYSQISLGSGVRDGKFPKTWKNMQCYFPSKWIQIDAAWLIDLLCSFKLISLYNTLTSSWVLEIISMHMWASWCRHKPGMWYRLCKVNVFPSYTGDHWFGLWSCRKTSGLRTHWSWICHGGCCVHHKTQ